MELIYVIEDDDNIRDLIKIALEGFGYQVKAFETAEDALQKIGADKPDLGVFDLMLPGMDGLAAIRIIRRNPDIRDMPIIVLTAKDKELDKVIGLDGGADDYMTKPFGVLELAARIRLQLRKRAPKEAAKDVLAAGQLKMSPKTREAWFRERLLELTYKEYELLLYLLENQARVVSREELLNNIWGYEYDGESRTLDMHIRTLRQKLGEEGGDYIKTIRGVGYRFRVTASPENEG